MRIVRLCLLSAALAIVAAPLAQPAFAIWPFTNSNSTTTTKKTPRVYTTKAAAKQQQPSTMQRIWNGVTAPFSPKKEPTKKPNKPIGFSAITSPGKQLS